MPVGFIINLWSEWYRHFTDNYLHFLYLCILCIFTYGFTTVHYSTDSPSVISGPATSASLGHLLGQFLLLTQTYWIKNSRCFRWLWCMFKLENHCTVLSLTPLPKPIVSTTGYMSNGSGIHVLRFRILASPAPESKDLRANMLSQNWPTWALFFVFFLYLEFLELA